MKTWRFSVVMTVICLIAPAVLIAALAAPTGLTVAVDANAVVLDWNDVDGAVKYSVDMEGEVTYLTIILVDGVPQEVEATADVEASFETSDRTDGGDMGDSDLTVPIGDLAAAIAAELGIDAEDVLSFDGSAKVKALNPGKGAGRQNNPFSDPVAFSVDF